MPEFTRANQATYADGTPTGRIRYLSFEGGGGKGLAYLGALTAMSHPAIDVMTESNGEYVLNTDRIEGISGASAGAITAVLLASGHSLRELYDVMTDDALLDFYDPPGDDESFVPAVRKGPVQPLHVGRFDGPHSIDNRILGASHYDRSDHGSTVERGTIEASGLAIKHPLRGLFGLTGVDDPVLDHVFEDFRGCLHNLYFDFGMFSGCYARTHLANLIDPHPWDGHEITFDDFVTEYDTEIRLVGSNLTTMEPHVFSTESTPEFKVADAVRISMSFPGIFKPVPIGDPIEDAPEIEQSHIHPADEDAFAHLEGVWADGGATNNNPIHAFDEPGSYRLPEGMVGIRLGQDEPNRIDGLSGWAGALVNTLLSVRSDGEIRSDREARQVVDLPLGELSLTQFSPSERVLRRAIYESTLETFDFFSIPVSDVRPWVDSRLGLS
ncbi:patatin-like phospholipase family protein [Natrarchaeobius chitinivorans]|uniref:PNPLA domain-containing protein n=1 Tax=Natrarchaeobius chitinivorans TaxID=1679083 RepID=A0A3N6MCZ6_NATCH|nr:patatin-like phospholipase family protein [Natrarchaeobius chitinivorans]RQG94450.1 hypothetical protein EA473_12195 [Natrarchaeobius chitinivorans]